MAKTNLPILEQRRIEASIIKPIYQATADRLGPEAAREILAEAECDARPEEFTRYGSARKLYNFDIDNAGEY